MTNPWTWLIAFGIAAGLVVGGVHYGTKVGIDSQKAADQSIFDDYNASIAKQKVEANNKLRDKNAEIVATLVERDNFKSQLETEHVKNTEITNKLAAAYSAYSLRFRAEENSRRGNGGSGSGDAKNQGPGNATTTIVQLPDEITRNLRQLAYEADQLNDDYKLCYGYVHH